MRIGILGGSFDPPHIGHLWIAEAVREALKLNEIRWIPAAISPLKPNGPVASNEQRRQMVALAVSGCPEYLVDDRELNRGDVSYTVDTLQDLKIEFPKAEFFLIMGSDSLAFLPQWHRPKRLLELATLVVLQRGAAADVDFHVLSGLASETQIQRVRESQVTMPLIELSSSEIRERLRSGQSIRFKTSRSVEAYIKAEKLYQASSKNTSRT